MTRPNPIIDPTCVEPINWFDVLGYVAGIAAVLIVIFGGTP